MPTAVFPTSYLTILATLQNRSSFVLLWRTESTWPTATGDCSGRNAPWAFNDYAYTQSDSLAAALFNTRFFFHLRVTLSRSTLRLSAQ
jgi:hypothetical protein